MKNILKLLTAVAGIALGGSASAQIVVNFTGSTAFRSGTHTAILNTMTGETYAYTGGSLGSASQSIFHGTIAGNVCIIRCGWSGSTAGIRDVAQGNNLNFIDESVLGSGSGTGSTPVGTDPDVPHVAMSDVAQSSSIYTTPTLTDSTVAVTPFRFIASNGAPADLTDVSSMNYRSLLGAGELPLALFTGDPADHGEFIFGLGRDPGSGTRVAALANTGYSVFNQVLQWQPTVNTAPNPDEVTGHVYFPAGGGYVEGDNGYSSGGLIVPVLGATTAAIGGYYISPLGINDSNNAVALGAKALSFDGVTYSETAVREGKYTHWSYQHLFYKSTLDATRKTIANAIRDNITSAVTTPNINVSTMQVTRVGDGTEVVPLY